MTTTVPPDGASKSVAGAGTSQTRTPVLHRPLASFYLLLASSGMLLTIGLVMVFSASSVRSYATYDTSYAIAMNQAIYIGLGLPCLYVASRLPVRVWRAAANPALLVVIGLLVLVLVPGVGKNIDGATRWIPLPGGFNLQPSELAKLALAIWGADLLVRKKKLLGQWKHLFVPLVPVATLLALLIMLEPDMGTTMSLLTVLVALLWVAGTPMRYFAVFFGALVASACMLAVSAPYRLARVTSFMDPFADPQGGGYQAVQGFYAISSGGLFGVGLGASQSKWSGGLPNAHTDYIFAVIGEELGLLGTFTVLLLVATMTYAGVRIARRASDPFVRYAASGVTAWLAGQSIINLGAVVGLLPITGIPLPLVSFGGSAMIPTLTAIGMLLSFARAEPGAAAALRGRRGALARLKGTPARTPARTTTRTAAPASKAASTTAPTAGRTSSRAVAGGTSAAGRPARGSRAVPAPRRPAGRR